MRIANTGNEVFFITTAEIIWGVSCFSHVYKKWNFNILIKEYVLEVSIWLLFL
jgi:hypothetical protein